MVTKFEAEKHYETICSWWASHGWTPLPLGALPKTGFVVPGYAAGFLYKTDSQFAVMEWIVANPNSDKIGRRAALDAVVAALLKEAETSGYLLVQTSVEHLGLIARYETHGFVKTDTGMSNMIRKFG
jgi:hypothetical protein